MRLNCEDCKKEKTCSELCGCMFGFCHFGEPKRALLNKHKNALDKLYCKNDEVKQFVEEQLRLGKAFVVRTKAKSTVCIANAINNNLHYSVRPIDVTYWQNERLFFFDGGVIVTDASFVS